MRRLSSWSEQGVVAQKQQQQRQQGGQGGWQQGGGFRSGGFWSSSSAAASGSGFAVGFLATVAVVGTTAATLVLLAAEQKKDYDAVAKDIRAMLDDPNYEDGSRGPVLIRLAWHAAGTYDKVTGTGGSGGGATMRFPPEAGHGANAGLQKARDFLEPLKKKYPWISYADLWQLAGAVAVEYLGGPKIPFRPGREDKPDGSFGTPDGRLPDATKGVPHLRDIFYRMGFNDQEIVALSGAHALGRCHRDRSGFEGPWTRSPTMLSNDYYILLLSEKWTEKKLSNGLVQFKDANDEIMMLPSDMALLKDPETLKWVKIYANDETKWKEDFGKAFTKLSELGVKFPPPAAAEKPWYRRFF